MNDEESHDPQSNEHNKIDHLLRRLWLLDSSDEEFDEVECELMDAVRFDPRSAHSYYSALLFNEPARLLWHLCANGCSFDLVAHVHFENEEACRERKSGNYQGSYPLHMACKNHCSVATINFLAKQYPGSSTQLDEEMNHPLHVALLHHSEPSALIPILMPRYDLHDLTVTFRGGDGFPVHVLDALLSLRSNTNTSIALETNPTNRESQHVIFDSSRGHGFCPEIKTALRITIGLQHLEGTILALSRSCRHYQVLALNIKFFQDLPVRAIARLGTLRHLFLQKGDISHNDFYTLLQALSRNDDFTRLHVRSSRTLRGASPIQLLALSHNLQVLDLGHNTMGPSLAAPLAALLLSTDTVLQHLDIGGNDIGAQGMQEVLDALGRNKRLITLNMVGEIADGLVTMLQEHNSTILGISLGLSHPLLKQVEYWLQTNQCGRSKLCRDTATKEDLVEILETACNVKVRRLAERDAGSCNKNVGLVYALLRTNPALWSR